MEDLRVWWGEAAGWDVGELFAWPDIGCVVALTCSPTDSLCKFESSRSRRRPGSRCCAGSSRPLWAGSLENEARFRSYVRGSGPK